MSLSSEYDEEQAYKAWLAEKARRAAEHALLIELVDYVLRRATQCSDCREIALWRFRATKPGASGNPREDLLCDQHRKPGSVAIEGSGLLRRVAALR